MTIGKLKASNPNLLFLEPKIDYETLAQDHMKNDEPVMDKRRARAERKAYKQKWDFGTLQPFIAWDGEGIDLDGPGKAQSYCLFGCSTGAYIVNDEGLTSIDCFNLLLELKATFPRGIMCGFSTGYDTEMMLVDLPHESIARLHTGAYVWWKGFRLQYRKGKTFEVRGRYCGKVYSARLYDIWSFFGSSFINAIKKFVPHIDPAILNRIIQGKARRGGFTVDELDTVMIPYWLDELDVIVEIMIKLRTLLYKAGLFPRSWHGPGAIASFLNSLHKIDMYMDQNTPKLVKDAAQSAYAAGRVECFMIGRLCRTAYKYDRRSAYPSGMVHLPALKGRAWTFQDMPDEYDPSVIQPFGLYDIEYRDAPCYKNETESYYLPQPLFHRTKQTTVSFPYAVDRWCWGVELLAAVPDQSIIRVKSGIVLSNYMNTEYPFAWVEDMFENRMAMKRAGLEEQIALKLGLNSLYGKMAQQRGWHIGDSIPKWHQLEWAGFVTAHNRAEIYRAARLAGERGILISIETDAIVTSEPMPELDITSEKLGTWELETFDDIVYLQSGVYMTFHAGPCKERDECNGWHLKYRGFDADSISSDDVLKYLERTSLRHDDPQKYLEQPLWGETTRFMGSKLAATRTNGMDEQWRVWRTEPKDIVVGYGEKRVHRPRFCRACQAGNYYGSNCMHDMAIATWENLTSQSYSMKLPWRTVDNQAMDYDDFLAELGPEMADDFMFEGILEG